MSAWLLSLHFLSLLLLCCVSPSSFLVIKNPPLDLVTCRAHHIQTFTQFKNEFDTRGCNHSDNTNGVWCDNSTGAVTKLRLRSCLNGILKPNSTLFRFHHLRHIDLAFNNFTSSSLPSEFGSFSKLEGLVLHSNGFIGQVPYTISNLSLLSVLDLSSNEFTGNFPLVQNLTKLNALQLQYNNFYGTIPSSLFTMPFLSILHLRNNHFTGSIESPNSSTSSMLEFLYLGNNQFEGQILEPVSKFTNLKDLDVSFLNTSYPIELSLFSSFQSLLNLDLTGNNISPASLKSGSDISVNLESLTMSLCGIIEFPNIMKNLQNLEYLDISKNRIKGEVPEWLWKLPNLSLVTLSNNSFNSFEGSNEVLVNSSLLILDLSINSFNGAFPNPPLSIRILGARENSFTGNIPLSICNCKSLTHLTLPYNNFTGSIPNCLNNLMVLNLRKNNLEGSIPDEFYVNASLQTLNVGYNRLSGKLPRSLLNCSSLKFLSVDYNRIKDTFPLWLKALPDLQVLILRSNKFYGPISSPHQDPLGFPELRILELSDNKFNGTLPPSYFMNWKASSLTINEGGLYMEYTKTAYGGVYYTYIDNVDLQYKGLYMEQEKVLTSYSAIDFSGNRFEGDIPESIGLLKALIALNLSNNAFTGHIPSSLSNVTELESLDLSRNQLSGTIPNGLKTLSFLAYVNVSHNQLEGEIPQGTQITGQPKSSFEGNVGLCGLPLEISCFGTNSPPRQELKEEDEKEMEMLSWKAVAIGYGPGVLLGLAIAQVIASYKPQWLVKMIGPDKRRTH